MKCLVIVNFNGYFGCPRLFNSVYLQKEILDLNTSYNLYKISNLRFREAKQFQIVSLEQKHSKNKCLQSHVSKFTNSSSLILHKVV